jgi:hypothetical protein
MATFNHLIRIADRLGQVETGSPKADRAIHDALGREGPMLAYTRQEEAARLLLPTGFEWRDATYSSGLVYASCRRQGLDEGFPHPHHGQWGKTPALAMCGAVMRAWAALA